VSKKIHPVPVVHTPKNWAEIEQWVDAHTEEERVHLYAVAYMAWNLAASLVNEGITE